MSREIIDLIFFPIAVFIARLWSRWEHRKAKHMMEQSSKDITEIKIYINGELEKKLEQAREEGRQEVLKSIDKK